MRKFRTLFVILCVLLLSGCGSQVPKVENEPFYEFTDSTGAQVVLSQEPERVAVLFSSFAEIWTLSGGEVTVTVGEGVERGFAPEGTCLVDDGAGKQIDLELLFAAQPDFVIGSADIEAQQEACQAMKEAGIPAALFQVDTFDQYLNMLKICTEITGDSEAFLEYGTRVEEDIQNTLQMAAQIPGEKKRILFIRAGSQYSSTKAKRASDHFACMMLEELGAYNIAEEATVLLDGLSLEEILLQDPEYIVLTTMGNEEAAKSYIEDLFAQPGWRELTAVKLENYVFLPKELFHYKPNARWGDAYAYLAELLYPELSCYE